MNQNYLESKDLYLSAFLCLNKTRLLKTRKKNSILIFQFEVKPNTNDLVMEFFSGNAKVEPVHYVESIKRLRRLIHEQN